MLMGMMKAKRETVRFPRFEMNIASLRGEMAFFASCTSNINALAHAQFYSKPIPVPNRDITSQTAK